MSLSADRAAKPEKFSAWAALMSLLGGRTPAFSLATAALVIVLMISTGVLVYQNGKQNAELARLQGEQQRQSDLQREIDASRERESELRSSIDSERETSDDLKDDLQRERTRREQLEHEKNKQAISPNTEEQLIATVTLTPSLGGHGKVAGHLPDVRIGIATKRLSMRLSLPDDIMPNTRLTVRLNQKVIASDLVPRVSGTKKTVNVNVPVQSLNKGRNQLDVLGATGRPTNYGFNVENK